MHSGVHTLIRVDHLLPIVYADTKLEMAKDNRRGNKDKNDERIKSKKKMVTQDASPETSSSRRSSRSSSKQTKEIPSSTRKSKRLEKSKPSDSPPIKRKSKRNQEQMTTTPTKRYSRRNKQTYVGSSGSEQHVEEPASSTMKSKKKKVKRSLKMDSKKDETHEKKDPNVGGRKRKRVASSVDKASSTSQRIKTEATSSSNLGDENDKESQDKSSQATSSSNRDVDSGSKSIEDKGDDDVEECSDRTGEESTLKCSETPCSTSSSSLTNFSVEEINGHTEVKEESPNSQKSEEVSHDAVKEPLNDTTVDSEHVPDVGSPSKKSLNGESIENGSETAISGKSSSPTKKIDSDVCTDVNYFWVPVQISNVQLEQYCSMLLTNAMALSSCSKSDTVGALHDILVSNRKCCDHPYIVDQSLQGALTKDLEPVKFLEVGIKASGKLQFLDLILPEMRKRELRVLILFQPLSGTGKDSTSIGDILDDFVRQRFGEDSYERVDAVVTTPSRRQAALNNFNNKEMGRFIFLLDYRACLPSIKLLSVDTIIIFDSDWNPANDLRALQKIAIDSQPEKIKIFRLYTSCTLEEKILKLSEHNVTIDKGLQNLSRSTTDALLMWGATYLFKKLTEFHSENENISNEEQTWNELKEDFLNLITDKHYKAKLIIPRVEQSCENVPLTNELPDGEQPHTFWKKLLVGRDPCWKYLTMSTPRQRKRPQLYEHTIANASNDDVGRKRKKTPPVTEKTETKEACTVVSSDGSQMSPGDFISCASSCDETSFRQLLKLNISELCRVLKLSDEVKKMVERFLEYVIENYQVNKEPANTLQALLISLCWIGCSLLKKKLDRRQSLAIVKKRLNFSCEEEETNSVCLKLETAKEMFLLHRQNQKKTKIRKEINPDVVKVEIPDSPDDQYVTISPDVSDLPEGQNDSHGSNNSNSLPAPAPQEKVPPPPIQPLVSPPSVPTNSVEIQNESNQVQDNLQTEKVEQLIPETPLVEQQQEAPPQVLESTVVDPNDGIEPWSNLFNSPELESYNRGATRMPSCSDPLQAELENFSELRNTVNNFYEAIKVKLKSDYDKEVAEIIAKINRKYEVRCHKAEKAFQLKRSEIDMNVNKVIMNKILAEAFRSKCRDVNPFNPSQIQGEMQYMHQFHGQPSFSPGQSSGTHQVNNLHPPLQIVHQSTNLFSNTPARTPPPPPNTNNPITPSANIGPTTTPPNITASRPPPNTTPSTTRTPPNITNNPLTPSPPPANISTTTIPSRPPPNITASRPPPTITPSTTRPPPNITSTRPPPNITPITPSTTRPQPNITLSTPNKPPPNITSTTPSIRNPRLTSEIRAPAPHIRPFKPSTSSNLPPSSATSSHTPAKPPLPPSSLPPTNPNSQPAQPVAPPPASTQLPSLNSSNPPATSSSSLPPMPLIPTSHSGLYSSGRPDVMSLSALDLLMNVDKRAGLSQTNVSPSQIEEWEAALLGKGGDGDLVCLSDDD
ncbi:hypothetical protein L1887_09990 [Cichorium endivia]|nr:hypothetical protein L1887_09990 [Cichorium endivia]